MKKTAESVWENCLLFIKQNVGNKDFETWFEPIKPFELIENSLYLQIPSEFFYEWLEEHYTKLLKAALTKELGPRAKLLYKLKEKNSSNNVNENSEKINYKIKEYVPSLKIPEKIEISNSFSDNFLSTKNNKEVFSMPIMAFNIVFKIIADLRNKTYYSKDKSARNSTQLSLFEKEFKTDHNSYANFTYKISELDTERNTNRIKEALVFLENYKKGWYKQKNENGKIINSYGGLISQPSYSDAKVSFLVSSYWIEKIIWLDESYFNQSLYNVLIDSKSINRRLFYLWLLKLGDDGTKMNYKNFCERFNLNYKTAKDVGKDFLKPNRNRLNEISSLSFNYSIKSDDISFKKYHLMPKNNTISKPTLSNFKIRKKIKYLKDRHDLQDKDLIILSNLMKDVKNYDFILKSYKDFVAACRKNKIKTDSFKQKEFLLEFQKILVENKGNIKFII